MGCMGVGFWLPLYVAAICHEADGPGLARHVSLSLAGHLPRSCSSVRTTRYAPLQMRCTRSRTPPSRKHPRNSSRIEPNSSAGPSPRVGLLQDGPARPQRSAAPRLGTNVVSPRGRLWGRARWALDHRRARSGQVLRIEPNAQMLKGGCFTTYWEGPPARQAAALPLDATRPVRGLRQALRLCRGVGPRWTT